MSYNDSTAGRFLAALALSVAPTQDETLTVGDRVKGVTAAMRIALGRLPVAGVAPRVVTVAGLGPVRVWIAPLPSRPAHLRHHKRSTHRLLCECPRCHATMSAGRLHQHLDTPTCARRVARTASRLARRAAIIAKLDASL